MHEQLFNHAQYVYTPSTTSTKSSFSIKKTIPELKIPWIPIDPTSPNFELYARFKHAKPITITLQAGDMLYLPSLWFHRVSQQSGPRSNTNNQEPEGEEAEEEEEGEKEVEAAIAVNWWFDMEMQGSHWCLNQFIRRNVLDLDGREEEVGLLDD